MSVTGSPPAITRLLLLPSGAVDGVARVVAQYRPVVVYVSGSDTAAATGRGLRGIPIEALSALAAAEAAGDADAEAASRAVVAAADAARIAHPGEAVVLIGSSLALTLLVCHALGVPAEAASRFALEPGAVTVIEVDSDSRWALLRLNERLPAVL